MFSVQPLVTLGAHVLGRVLLCMDCELGFVSLVSWIAICFGSVSLSCRGGYSISN